MSPAAEKVAEVTDELTAGWEVRQIQDVAEVNPRVDKKAIPDDIEVSFVPMPAVEPESGQIDVSQTKIAKEVKKGFTAFLQGDVLFAKITPCMENGKMAIAPALINGYGFGSTEFHVLRPGEGIDPKYLYYYVSGKSFRGEAERFMTGAVGQKRVSTTYIKEATIPVAPLEDQKRIVAEIEKQFSRLDEAVDSLKRVKANLKRYKAAVLKAAVEGKLTEEWRKQNSDVEPASKLVEEIMSEPKRPSRGAKAVTKNASELPELPALWVWTNIAALKEFSLYGPRFSSDSYSESGIHVLRTSDISEGGRVNIDACPTIPLSEDYYQKYCVVQGDLLITRTGSLGTLAVYNDTVKAIPGAYLIQYRLNASLDTSWYAYYFLKSPSGQDGLLSGGAGVGRPNLNAPTIEAIPLPFPPLAEQKEIVQQIEKFLSFAEAIESSIETSLSMVETNRQSILQNAFSGCLGFSNGVTTGEID